MQLASISTIRKVIKFGISDIVNTTVTIVSLAFMRLRSYAVNGRKVTWRDRAMYGWVTMLWITSFHTPDSMMMANSGIICTGNSRFHVSGDKSRCLAAYAFDIR